MHLGVANVVVDGVLHAQHGHVSTQRHLAHAVRMEIKLVLHKVVKVLYCRQQDLQRLRREQSLNTLTAGEF